MGINWAEHTVEIEAPIEVCFDAIVDYESFPRWQSAVISTEVLSRDSAGLGEKVRLFLSAKGQKVDYTLDYRYERPTEIRWDFVEGHGVDDVDGSYTFADSGGGKTRATYNLGIDPSLPVPGIVARRIHSQALKRSVEELKDEAERRASEEGSKSATSDEEPEPREPGPRIDLGQSPPDRDEPAGEPAPEPWPAPKPEAEVEAEPAPDREPEPPPEPEATVLERASQIGRGVAEEAVRTGIGVAGSAVGLARGAAGTAASAGREAAGHLTGRLSRLLGRDR